MDAKNVKKYISNLSVERIKSLRKRAEALNEAAYEDKTRKDKIIKMLVGYVMELTN